MPDGRETDKGADGVVVGHAVVAAALDVGRDQIGGEPVGCQTSTLLMGQ